jgi:hypothetical protein
MQELAWGIAAAFAITTVVFIWLWLQARMAQRAAEQTMSDVRAVVAPAGADGSFDNDTIYQLLAKGQISLGGVLHSFGITQIGAATPRAFLTPVKMEHLNAGDSFSSIGGALHKIESRTAQAESAPVAASAAPPAPAPAAPTPAPQAPQPAAAPPSRPPPLPIPPVFDDDDDIEDIADRTIMFAPSRGLADAADANPNKGIPYLRVTKGPDAGTDFSLPFTHATIGRDRSNIIALNDQALSRLHCEVQYRRNQFVVHDNNSTNGTLWNGTKIKEQALGFGDTIEIADTVMTFTCDGYELKDAKPDAAISSFEACLEKEPYFILALQNLAFLLERDVARQKEAEPLWKRIMEIEQGR